MALAATGTSTVTTSRAARITYGADAPLDFVLCHTWFLPYPSTLAVINTHCFAPFGAALMLLATGPAQCQSGDRIQDEAHSVVPVDSVYCETSLYLGEPCPEIMGRTFLSIEEHECGLGPLSETTLCHWSITFDTEGAFVWRHSDVVEGGRIRCTEHALEIVRFRQPVKTSYDSGANILNWDGVDYRQSDEDGH